MRKEIFANRQHYHIFNRGVDKREFFLDRYDLQRFLESMEDFNAINPIGSMYEYSFIKKRNKELGNPTSKLENDRLVNVIAYCLNPNHYHLLLEQLIDDRISMFMKRLGGGYAKYFNEKYERTGTLFQGRFKAVHIASNEYLLHVNAYINLNNKVHQLGNPTSKSLSLSSWKEYTDEKIQGICKKDIILKQFQGKEDYVNFAENSLQYTIKSRMKDEEWQRFLVET